MRIIVPVLERDKNPYDSLFQKVALLRRKATRHELMVKLALDDAVIKNIFQYGVICRDKSIRIVDFCLPEHNLFIEIDGDTHNSKIDKEFDGFRERNILDKHRRFQFIRIRNELVDEKSNDLPAFLLKKIGKHCRWSKRREVNSILLAFQGLSRMDDEFNKTVGYR